MKGLTKKLIFEPKTLEDPLIKDGLEATSLLNRVEPYLLVGGIATQSYLPSLCRRPTSDVDFSMVRPLNYEDFKKMVRPITEYLNDRGYRTETAKKSRAFNLEIVNRKGEILCMEFSRRNNQSFEKNKRKLSRELDNAKTKILEERNSTYFVACPEDIVLPKLARSVGSLVREPSFMYSLPKKSFAFSSKRILRELSKISAMRKEAMINPTDLELAEKLRLYSDVYDTRVLSEIVGFNQQYLREAMTDWDAVGFPSFERNFLLSISFPEGMEKIFSS